MHPVQWLGLLLTLFRRCDVVECEMERLGDNFLWRGTIEPFFKAQVAVKLYSICDTIQKTYCSAFEI